MRAVHLTLALLLELACFAALAYAGAELGPGAWGVVLAVLLPAAAIVVWARWNAPRSARRLPRSRRVPLELAVLATGPLALLAAGAVTAAVVLAALLVVHAGLTAAVGDGRT